MNYLHPGSEVHNHRRRLAGLISYGPGGQNGLPLAVRFQKVVPGTMDMIYC